MILYTLLKPDSNSHNNARTFRECLLTMSHTLFCLALYQRCIPKYIHISVAASKYLLFSHLAECFSIKLHWKQLMLNHSVPSSKKIQILILSKHICFIERYYIVHEYIVLSLVIIIPLGICGKHSIWRFIGD